ncbi:MAG: glucosamine--fructose-6-phosphate aminotransferase [bacterium ADurb.Bin429]|nr:MAG: glucosamine--fructose-6-phosphate aminotransferase [bacterium ADurb.Bin429]
MCGLLGILAGNRQKRRVKDIEALTDVFTMMLLLSEHRGPHATGVAWVKQDGSMQVAKEPLPARQFVQSGAYIDWLLGVDREMTYLMGHTRWPSHGSVMNPANNHPLVVPVPVSDQPGAAGPPVDRMRSAMGSLALTHNGSLRAWERHFTRLQVPRTTQVDSELLARIAQRHAGATGLALDAILADLSPLEGSMSLALVATTRPEEIILLKGNMPLEVCIQPRARLLAYASEARILDRALAGEAGWETVPLAHGEGLVINTRAWTLHRVPFIFQGVDTVAGASYTGAVTGKERSR